MIFFSSDHHFGHEKLREFYPHRAAHASAEEVDEAMIAAWNNRVRQGDTVYYLGDFGMTTVERMLSISKRLNGRKILIPGNHDKKNVNEDAFLKYWEKSTSQIRKISVEKQEIVLCHFPIYEWEKMHHGAWHLHGHLHGKPHGIPGKIFDVGVDGHPGMAPYSFTEIKQYMADKPIRKHH